MAHVTLANTLEPVGGIVAERWNGGTVPLFPRKSVRLRFAKPQFISKYLCRFWVRSPFRAWMGGTFHCSTVRPLRVVTGARSKQTDRPHTASVWASEDEREDDDDTAS
jgi:hypothetical protein